MARLLCRFFLLCGFLFPSVLLAQQMQLSNIIGQLRIAKGDFPPHQILVELRFRGSPIYSSYADGDGKFGFYSLVPGEYHLIINDEAYYPVDERLVANADSGGVIMALLTLRPREAPQARDPAAGRASGSNRNLIGLSEYNKNFPKKAIKEFGRGVDADRAGNHEKAIAYYEAALKGAPDYYPAHNNLGSDYLGKADLADARREFEEVIRLNQSDAAGYFNLSNVCMMMGALPNAQRYLDDGMRREPDSAFGHFLLGSLEIKTGKFQEAEAALRETIRLSPTMAQARLQLINLMMQEEKKSEALEYLRDFVKTFPESSFTPKAKELLQTLENARLDPALPATKPHHNEPGTPSAAKFFW